MGYNSIAALLVGLLGSSVSSQVSFTLPDLEEKPENAVCPSAPSRPDWVANPSNEELTRSQLAIELYKQEGYRNVVEAGECTCDLRFPDWGTVSAAMETEFAGISRFRFLEIIPDIRRATKAYRREGRLICQAVGLR
ncbi:MAG: hypothetical protein ACU0B9_19215 [Limimaricola soesokkakensis]|uniref:hypothetical protein n=1 Tax=Limimaricola soesokkakensis TaxID=1343159 RepID=UPI00405A378D